jgi:hypothetical protein
MRTQQSRVKVYRQFLLLFIAQFQRSPLFLAFLSSMTHYYMGLRFSLSTQSTFIHPFVLVSPIKLGLQCAYENAKFQSQSFC